MQGYCARELRVTAYREEVAASFRLVVLWEVAAGWVMLAWIIIIIIIIIIIWGGRRENRREEDLDALPILGAVRRVHLFCVG